MPPCTHISFPFPFSLSDFDFVYSKGFINLVDNYLGDGGFSCVPGFNTVLKDYAQKTNHTEHAKKMEKEYAFVEVLESESFYILR